jgi:poly(3-hydroxybutyrate) depolymerase
MVSFQALKRSRLFRVAAALGLAVLGLVALCPLCLLIITARTMSGRLAGLAAAALLLAVGLLVFMLWTAHRDHRHLVALGLSGVVAIGLVIVLARLAPVGRGPSGDAPGLRSVFPVTPPRPTFLDLVPEVDRVTLGAALLTRLDPWMGREHGRRIRRVLASLYDEMASDHEAGTLRSNASAPFLELIGASFDAGHYYAYVPPHAPGERLGAVIVLHGNAGNFQLFAWAWRPFADRHRFAIICPTYGFGFWGEGGGEAVERARRHALTTLPIDEDRVFLGGISDGGNGVTRSGTIYPDAYAGLIYVSPTMVVEEVTSREFLAGWQGRPVLVLQGDDDHNVLKRDVDAAVEAMRARGVAVTYDVFPGEDHFLFFGRRDDVFDRVEAWQTARASLGPPWPNR